MAHDAYRKPPETLRASFKKYQRLTLSEIESDSTIVDFNRGLLEHQREVFKHSEYSLRSTLQHACEEYFDSRYDGLPLAEDKIDHFEAVNLPGLVIIPSLLPVAIQAAILDRTFHRDLSNPQHKTNVHFHHEIKYPESGTSFFDLVPSSSSNFLPYDASVHKPLTIQQFLIKKLRWMTLGGQYDWTEKKYPSEKPPNFPPDLQRLLGSLFPDTVAEAAIVNVYSPGDVLSLHRDVSEFCGQGLISISIGCDALFMIASEDEDNRNSANDPRTILRLRSGDAVYMTGQSRYAWHGVPSIIANTCPKLLEYWPCAHEAQSDLDKAAGNGPSYSQWRHWLANKRINLNVRQMFESTTA